MIELEQGQWKWATYKLDGEPTRFSRNERMFQGPPGYDPSALGFQSHVITSKLVMFIWPDEFWFCVHEDLIDG